MVDSLSTDKSLEVKRRSDDNCPNYDIKINNLYLNNKKRLYFNRIKK